MLNEVTESEASSAMNEVPQGSSQQSHSSESSDKYAASDSNPAETSGAAELVIDVSDASASFSNNPNVSRLRIFGAQTSIVEREIDNIFNWQSKRFHSVDRTHPIEVSSGSSNLVASSERRHKKFLRKAYSLIEKIRESTFYLVIKYLLLVGTFSIEIMGAAHKHQCPASEVTPFRVQLIGGFGTPLIFARMVVSLKNRFPTLVIKCMNYMSIWLCWGFAIALFIEIFSFYKFCPDFENIDSLDYCNETFYYFVHYMNITAVVIGFAALLMHIPCFKETTDISYVRMA